MSVLIPSVKDHDFLKNCFELKLQLDKFGHADNDGTCVYCDNESEKCIIDVTLCEYYTCNSCYNKDKNMKHCHFELKKD